MKKTENPESDDRNFWRVPTPTDIRANENIDTLSRMLFFEILNGCSRNKYHRIYFHGNKRIDIELERGQFVFVISKYQKELNLSRKRIEKSLEILSKWYNEMKIEKKPFGTIITVINYDELTEMKNESENEVKTKLKRSENEVKTKLKRSENEVKSITGDRRDRKELKLEKKEILKIVNSINQKNLIPLFLDFLKNRRDLKKKPTPKAIELLVKKINSATEADARVALETSIENGWAGLFPKCAPPKPPPREKNADGIYYN